MIPVRRGGRSAVAHSPRRGELTARAAASAAAGLAWVLALPPSGVWWLGPVAAALLGAAVLGLEARWRALFGGTTGLVVFAVTLRWATIFTVPGYAVLVVVEASFPALAAVLVPRGRWTAIVALPATLTLAEWLRHQWPLGGLPVSSLALGQVDGPLLPLAALGGPPLLTFAVAALGALLLAAITARGWMAGIAVLGGLGLLGVGTLVPSAPGTAPASDPLLVAAVQGGGQRGLPAARTGPTDVLGRHLRASDRIDGEVDLVLWPENVVDIDGPLHNRGDAAVVSSLAKRLQTPVVAGVTTDAPASPDDRVGVRRFRNLAVAFAADGTLGATYDKVVRVPFGEYVPARPVVARIADLSLIPREAVPGSGPGVLDTEVGRVGVLISFEGLFASRARAAARAGATLLLVPTNAASYVTDDVPAQQVAAARLRAAETGRWVALAGPTGPSAIVRHDGVVQARSRLEVPALLEEQVQPRTGRTPYTVLGDLPVLTVASLAALVAYRPRRRLLARPGRSAATADR